jgi:glucose-6-phosphate isomerase
MFNRYGDAVAPKRIMVMTGEGSSTLKDMADKDGCGIFNISKNYIGNYGILSPASLFPMAVAGVEVDRLLAGAEVMATDSSWDIDAGNYAVARKLLNDKGKIVEIFQYSQANLENLAIWISHLFMESDSKEKKGIYTTTMNIARDFKAKGQFMAGNREGFIETEISAVEVENDMNLPKDIANMVDADTVAQLNKAIIDTIKDARTSEEREYIKVEVPKMDAFNLGQIIYFFLMSASISAHMFGVDPFERNFIDKIKDKLKIKR